MFARPTLYLTIKDTTDDNVSMDSSSNTCSVGIYYCFVIPIAHVNMGCCDTSCQKVFFFFSDNDCLLVALTKKLKCL